MPDLFTVSSPIGTRKVIARDAAHALRVYRDLYRPTTGELIARDLHGKRLDSLRIPMASYDELAEHIDGQVSLRI